MEEKIKFNQNGCLPDKEDSRDFKYSDVCKSQNVDLTKTIDLRDNMPPIWCQYYGACTAYSFAASLAFQLKDKRGITVKPSKSFLYYMARYIAKTTEYDCGVTLREGAQAVKRYGICQESEHYESLNFKDKPRFESLAEANTYRAFAYYRLNTFEDIIDSLTKRIPVIFSSAIGYWKEYAIKSDGICREALNWYAGMANTGHAMVIVGYIPNFNIDGKIMPVFIVRNSWGEFYDKGYIYVPAHELFNYNCKDKWVIVMSKYDLDEPDSSQVDTSRISFEPYLDSDASLIKVTEINSGRQMTISITQYKKSIDVKYKGWGFYNNYKLGWN